MITEASPDSVDLGCIHASAVIKSHCAAQKICLSYTGWDGSPCQEIRGPWSSVFLTAQWWISVFSSPEVPLITSLVSLLSLLTLRIYICCTVQLWHMLLFFSKINLKPIVHSSNYQNCHRLIRLSVTFHFIFVFLLFVSVLFCISGIGFFFFFGSQTFDLCFSFSNGDMTRTYTSPCVLSPCVSVLINDSVIGRFPSHLCDTVMYISLWQTTVLCLYLLYP